MLSKEDAAIIISRNLPEGTIQAVISYEDLYIFQVFHDDEDEGEYDPFFSVDQVTGEFKEFSVLTDGNFDAITNLFLAERG